VRSGHDAWDRIKSGADLVQIYTPIVVEGPRVVGEMLNQIQDEMRKEGIKDIN
jgi:dihydroorotate dehydrogenase